MIRECENTEFVLYSSIVERCPPAQKMHSQSNVSSSIMYQRKMIGQGYNSAIIGLYFNCCELNFHVTKNAFYLFSELVTYCKYWSVSVCKMLLIRTTRSRKSSFACMASSFVFATVAFAQILSYLSRTLTSVLCGYLSYGAAGRPPKRTNHRCLFFFRADRQGAKAKVFPFPSLHWLLHNPYPPLRSCEYREGRTWATTT